MFLKSHLGTILRVFSNFAQSSLEIERSPIEWVKQFLDQMTLLDTPLFELSSARFGRDRLLDGRSKG